jgi:hypothetical protein
MNLPRAASEENDELLKYSTTYLIIINQARANSLVERTWGVLSLKGAVLVYDDENGEENNG